MARLFIATPCTIDPQTFPEVLEDALSGGDVACLLIAPMGVSDAARQRIAEVLVPVIQRHGVAALVVDDSRAAGRARADGVHIATSDRLADALETFHPGGIVGVAGPKSRHEAMEAGEANVDYVFFGNLEPPETPEIHARNLDLALWWAPLFECPCVILAGNDLATVTEAAATGAEFVALRDAIWDHPDGPKAAVTAANALLEAQRETV